MLYSDDNFLSKLFGIISTIISSATQNTLSKTLPKTDTLESDFDKTFGTDKIHF